ncbi:Thymidylate synthase complementing protein [Lentzea xinjiangensis]|uniref:Thymidylate synthase complementing protein n=1 Tax=Lentzea xinjiangensis TaxID=402600 RepID=A0A1H9WQN5_9PSEU|nr:Thymidylate synthase complementing protein [Lentzea xinjiangensis]
MTGPSAVVIADSTCEGSVRLTTMEIRFHRFILPQLNSHRVFSRNSSSSRAIPVSRQLANLGDQRAAPLSWPAEKRGMQGGLALEDPTEAQAIWHDLGKVATEAAEALQATGLHKSVTNRVLEPFMWHTSVVTSTAWGNFFLQRDSELAQPEVRALAQAMAVALAGSTPRQLRAGEWHLPYVSERDAGLADSPFDDQPDLLPRISAARCARTSYLTHDGRSDPSADLKLFDKLISADPPHWSPLEHVATPWPENRAQGELRFTDRHGARQELPLTHLPRVGNLLGWRSLRTEVEAAQGARTFT